MKSLDYIAPIRGQIKVVESREMVMTEKLNPQENGVLWPRTLPGDCGPLVQVMFDYASKKLSAGSPGINEYGEGELNINGKYFSMVFNDLRKQLDAGDLGRLDFMQEDVERLAPYSSDREFRLVQEYNAKSTYQFHADLYDRILVCYTNLPVEIVNNDDVISRTDDADAIVKVRDGARVAAVEPGDMIKFSGFRSPGIKYTAHRVKPAHGVRGLLVSYPSRSYL